MSACDSFMSKCELPRDITILHVYILINLHVDINKSHLNIIILHVDIINFHAGDRNIFISKLKLTIYQLTIKNKA